MISKIFVQFSETAGRKVFRVEPNRHFSLQTDLSDYQEPQNRFTPAPFSSILPAGMPARSSDSGFLLSSIMSNLLIPTVTTVLPRPALPLSLSPVPQQNLRELLLSGASYRPKVPVEPIFRPVAPPVKQTPVAPPAARVDAREYTKEVIGDRIEYVLKKSGVSRAYAEPIFDALYNQQIDRLYTDVYGERYGGPGWERSDLDNRAMIELYQATKVFRSFAALQLNGRGDAWHPRTELERKMSGEWFAEYVDETVEAIIKRGELDRPEPQEIKRIESQEQECCKGVPEPLQQAYKSTPDIDQFNPKAFEGLPALFELPRWDLERSAGKEPRLNRLDVDCETILSYDYPAVLAHRITMLKAEGGDEKDIRILEDLKDNIDKVLNEERYLGSSVWEANNTARHLALEGEEGLYRAYENSVGSYVQQLKMEPAVMKQVSYLGMPQSMAKSFFTLFNDPAYKGRLTEAMEAYVKDQNSNIERYDMANYSVASEETPTFKSRLLQKVVDSFGKEKAV